MHDEPVGHSRADIRSPRSLRIFRTVEKAWTSFLTQGFSKEELLPRAAFTGVLKEGAVDTLNGRSRLKPPLLCKIETIAHGWGVGFGGVSLGKGAAQDLSLRCCSAPLFLCS